MTLLEVDLVGLLHISPSSGIEVKKNGTKPPLTPTPSRRAQLQLNLNFEHQTTEMFSTLQRTVIVLPLKTKELNAEK
jgi:hypothetical protein